ncbi:MAG TPA: glycosyltransferase family 2 protein [Permianibacter sp.]|nr:glycosyltransferase family 2 protein [Permianibacter sp.]
MNLPRFSVIIPCYNYGYLVERAIRSVHEQMAGGDELIVINDGSTDDTAVQLERLQLRYPRVRHINQPNAGVAATRNRGIELASNDSLIFLDADDELLPDALDKLRAVADRAEMIVADYLTRHADGSERYRSVGRVRHAGKLRFLDFLDKKLVLANGACVMHKAIFSKMKFPEGLRNTEDVPVFAYALAMHSCFHLNTPVLRVHRHADSLRSHLGYSLQAGDALVDAIFRSELLPDEIMRYRPRFLSNRLLSQFRSAYLGKAWAEADELFRRAIAVYPAHILKLSYLRKFLLMKLRGRS